MPVTTTRLLSLAMFVPLALLAGTALAATAHVESVPVPDGGIQPQVVTDATGRVHVVYFKGEPGAGDLFYVRSDDGCRTFSPPLRVNSRPNAAIATGTVRGAHVAMGRNGRIHVAWMGAKAEQSGAGKAVPMLYARLSADGKSFEPQRNLIGAHPGLDGGGSVAADAEGNVFVAWHAPGGKGDGEEARQVFLTRSTDDGDTFEPERPVLREATGVCACCGMRVLAPGGGRVFVVYRSALKTVNRDVHLLRSDDAGRTFRDVASDPWKVGQCVMSTASAASSARGSVLAWETTEQIRLARFAPDGSEVAKPAAVPGAPKGRKHPSVAMNPAGGFVVAWAEGTGWNRGGAVAWQAFDADGNAIEGGTGRAEGLPAWGLPAVAAVGERFVVIY
jgi:hypothetical protein